MKKTIIGFYANVMLGIGIMFSSCSGKKSAIEGYEWLEGKWKVESEYLNATMVVSKNIFTIESDDQRFQIENNPIHIGQTHNYYYGENGSDILALDIENISIAIDEENKSIILLAGEYESYTLVKVTEDKELDNNKPSVTDFGPIENDKITNSANTSCASDANHSLEFTKTYGWDDDKLKGKVKRVEESSVDYYDKDWGKWEITKEYDSYGRICYIKRDQNTFIFSSQIYPMGFPIHEKNGGIKQYSALYTYGRFLNPLHMVGYDASRDRQHMLSGEAYTFDYNDEGLINNIYCNNKLINKCEYDELGRLTKRYENNLPTLKIEWDKNSDNIDRTSFEIKWFNTDGQLIKTLPCVWDGNTLKVGESLDSKEYTFDGNTLRSYSVHVGFSMRYELSYNGNNVKIVAYNHNNNVLGTENLIYNDFGYLSEYKENGEKNYFRWEYCYDDYGNWTKATKYKITVGEDITFEEELNTITRKYEYYE